MKKPRLTVRVTRSDRACLYIGVGVFVLQVAALLIAGLR